MNFKQYYLTYLNAGDLGFLPFYQFEDSLRMGVVSVSLAFLFLGRMCQREDKMGSAKS